MAHVAQEPNHLASAAAEVHPHWGLFVALGGSLVFVGLIAFSHLFISTAASVYYVGAMMLLGGIMQIVHAFGLQTWSRFLFWLLSGLLYAVAGLIAFVNPLAASAIMTLMLAMTLIVSGALRVLTGFEAKPANVWGWIVAAGIVTILAGILVVLGWPGSSLWVLGLLLAMDLTLQGLACIAFGLTLREAR